MSSDDDRDDRDDLRDDEDDEYRPSDNPIDISPRFPSSVAVPQPQKRGRKPHPNPAVRSAREAARRANHSVIEKRRREKINGALSELRKLVPAQSEDLLLDTTHDAAAGNTSKIQPKEYKLEVLVRTVAYLNHLIHRVEILERVPSQRVRGGTDSRPSADPTILEPALCTNCANSLRRSDPHIASPRPPSSDASPSYQQRLPSLASLLNPGPSPSQQLLSPPASGSLHPTQRGSTSPPFPSHLPSLHLPSSRLSLPHQSLPQTSTPLDTSTLPSAGGRLPSMTRSPVFRSTADTRCTPKSSSHAKPSPVFPTVPSQQQERRERSHDDDLAISMLLNMSRSSSKGHSSSSSAGQPSPVECRKPFAVTSTEANNGGTGAPNTVTPSSLLGIHQSSPLGKGKRRPAWEGETERAKRTKVE